MGSNTCQIAQRWLFICPLSKQPLMVGHLESLQWQLSRHPRASNTLSWIVALFHIILHFHVEFS